MHAVSLRRAVNAVTMSSVTLSAGCHLISVLRHTSSLSSISSGLKATIFLRGTLFVDVKIQGDNFEREYTFC